MRPSRVASLLLVALAMVQAAHYGPLLPDTVATHFNSAGQPNEWSSRASFLIFNLVFVVGMAVVFLVLPPLLSKIPNEWINMPNKDYWLAPERREQSLAAMQSWMEWLGAATIALLLSITQMTIEANLSEPVALAPGVWLLSAAYGVGLIVWTAAFLRWTFRKPRDAGADA